MGQQESPAAASSVGDGSDGAPAMPFAARRRPARALIGWMDHEMARRSLVPDLAPNAAIPLEAHRAVQSAHDVVGQRDPSPQRAGADVVAELPPGLEGHCAKLAQHPHAAPLFDEGWTVRLVDLRGVRAFQPIVFTDNLDERLADIDPADVASVARLTLPLDDVTPDLPIGFDEAQQAWVVASANPNLRVSGRSMGPLQANNAPPGLVLGFVVTLSPSFVQVASYKGHWHLRDGYHRAYGLLRLGVTHAPAFVRSLDAFSDLSVPPGHLPQEAFLGDRPPLLPDYLDETVSASIEGFATTRVITVARLQTDILA